MPQLFVILFAFFVQFTDKAGSEHIALSQTALDKRAERGIAIDSLDYAVSPTYLDSLQALGCHIYHTSRWMNGVTIETDSNTLQRIAEWTFVDTIYLTRRLGDEARRRLGEEVKGEGQEGTWLTDPQTEQLNLTALHEAGFHGQGISMAIVDGGFQHVDTLSAFDAVRDQILGFYDLTDDSDSIFRSESNHGTKCFGTIAAQTSEYQGVARAATYYLIRSEEHNTESPKEMDNWVAAIELCDSLGVDILSSSLGYAMFDDDCFTLTYASMNGQITRCSRAAQIATRKGMLVVVSAGNEGNKSWHYISAPADADSILTVGAVDINDSIAAFSSWGPSSDGRVKPEVCALGKQTALIHSEYSSVIYGNGTSFACPLIAGMAACLWSSLPSASNIEIRERIIQSADRYTHPHDQYGYGIPNAWQAYAQTTDIETIRENSATDVQKVLLNGRLMIIHEGEMYDVMGNRLKVRG
ncbi:MAG: S8 family serine peptidase [Paludibacteraceae bacterium]|nr:S8 family serine peptidase [Paludibacteraceae bacterium]